ncbi:diuretic hormone 45 isoform X4 [Zerene cesonia]|uniref:diuretic hormone 45 isoform X4 n=1 Tax=Zerene cesonia TaxID=33412 RepID=UPI0018E58DE5|nr:diuretic hormone 45 isoform X4 [Zerene cesonia]
MQMWWAVCCVAVVVGSVYADAAPASSELSHSIDWTQLEPAPDDESIEYALSPGGRYPSAPWLYLLADVPRDSQVPVKEKMARSRRSYVSVNPAVELLQRGAYNNYMERLAHANRDFLNCIGKRDPWSNPDCKMKA